MTAAATTVTALIDRSIARSPKTEALRFRGERGWESLTYAQLDRRVELLARGLAASGARAGDRVALLADTRPEWTLLDLAIARAGAVSVPIHHATTGAECEHTLSHSGARLLVAESPELVALGHAAGRASRDLREVLAIEADAGAPALDELEHRGEGWGGDLPQPLPDDLFTIVYTSGTTGAPKGCVHSHATYSAAMRMTAALGSIQAGDLSYLYLPLAHVMGREVQSLTLAVGGCVAYLSGDRARVFDDLAELRPTFFAGAPRIYEKACDRALAHLEERGSGPALPAADALRELARARLRGEEVDERLEQGPFATVRDVFGGRLREAWSGAAPIADGVIELLVAAGVPVYEGYGMTETAAASALGTAGAVKLGTVGRPLPGLSMRIESGEVTVRGPSVFCGYYRDERATAQVLRDGRLHTGDLGEIDADGFLRITGRKKDVITTSGGKHVVPRTWEDEVRRAWFVDEVVMVGDRRPYLTALVVPRFALLRERLDPGASRLADAELASDERVNALVERRVADVNSTRPGWARVRRFAVLDRPLSREAGEVTAMGKVRRPTVAERHRERIDRLYRAAERA